MGDEIKDKKGNLDELDLLILDLLKSNSKMKMQDIGEKIHLTGQAVSNRINKMERLGVIKGYSLILDKEYMPPSITAFVTVFMKLPSHSLFKQFFDNKKEIIEAHRISGDGCYMLKVEVSSQENLAQLLDEILEYGNYKVNISINQVK